MTAHRGPLLRAAAAGLVLTAFLGGCQAAHPAASPAGAPTRWLPYRQAGTVADLTVPRADGTLTVLAGGRLHLLGPGGRLSPFAQGPGGFAAGSGPESYLALVPDIPVPGAGCSFTRDTVFALWPRVSPGMPSPGVVKVTRSGQARRFASLPGTFPDGIAYDSVGRFGHRLLVTSAVQRRSTLFSIDCAGRITTISARLPQLEGGLSIAPRSFGAYGGDLIATDELTGRIWAISPAGQATLIARPALPVGQDIGVESTGFVPAGFGAGWAAYLADRITPGNPHPGTGHILRISATALLRTGARPGDLIVASEGGAQTVLVRCSSSGCTVRRIAAGPPPAHGEGHIIFARLG